MKEIIIIITTDCPAACYESEKKKEIGRRRRSEWQLIKSPRKREGWIGMRDGGEHEMDLLSIEEQRVLGLFVFVSVSDRSISPSRTTEWMGPGSMKIAGLSSRQLAATHCRGREKWESRARRTTKVSSKQERRQRSKLVVLHTLVDGSSFCTESADEPEEKLG